jgi:Yip1 domain
MSHLINIFLEPSKVFTALKEKPTFIMPFLVIAAATMLFTFIYFMKVDSTWFIDNSLASSAGDMSANEIAQVKKVMPGAQLMGYVSLATTPIMLVIVSVVMALYFMMAGKITGSATSFKNGLSLSSWANMPSILGSIVGLVGVLGMEPQTSLESLMLTNIDPLFMQLSVDSPWSKLAKTFNLLTFWTTFLTALGWKVWGKTSWFEAIVVASIPSAIIYGGMAIWALI